MTQSGSFGAHSLRLLQLIPGSPGVEVASERKERAFARRLGGNKDQMTWRDFEKVFE